MRRRFHTLDVFTETPLRGNPLAVVLDADGLATDRMQAIAREFNLSETVFVCEPRDPLRAARLQIFTPLAELPFAGHPTIGAVALLAELRASDRLDREEIGLEIEEPIGVLSCAAWRRKGRATQARFALPALPKPGAPAPPVEVLAGALSLAPDDIGFDRHHPSVWSAGVEFIFAPIRSLEAIARARPALDQWPRLGASDARLCLYAKETVDPDAAIHARVFAPGLGVAEDPATGSAAAAFAGLAAAFEAPEDGDHLILIEQGLEMARPSRIALSLAIRDGRLASGAISGAAVRFSEGSFDA